MLTCVYQLSAKTVRLTLGCFRIQASRLRVSSMLTRMRPSSHAYHVATVIGKPSGRITAITAGLGCLKNSTTSRGRFSTLGSRQDDHSFRKPQGGSGGGAAYGEGGDQGGQERRPQGDRDPLPDGGAALRTRDVEDRALRGRRRKRRRRRHVSSSLDDLLLPRTRAGRRQRIAARDGQGHSLCHVALACGRGEARGQEASAERVPADPR